MVFPPAHRYVSFDGTTIALQQDFSYSTTWNASPSIYWSSKQTTLLGRSNKVRSCLRVSRIVHFVWIRQPAVHCEQEVEKLGDIGNQLVLRTDF
jgi:hypothetical protein